MPAGATPRPITSSKRICSSCLFPHVTRACRGILFDTVDTVVRQMRKASTTTGLRTTVNVIRRLYQTGREAADDFKDNMTIHFDQLLPKWNYVAKPQ